MSELHLLVQNVQNPQRAVSVGQCKYTKVRRGWLKYSQRVSTSLVLYGSVEFIRRKRLGDGVGFLKRVDYVWVF
jgi:hypothetical protein